MKRVLVLFLELLFISSLVFAMYWNYRYKKTVYSSSKLIVNTEKLFFMDKDLEETLVFLLTRQVGAYEGAFEIIGAVNLGAAEMTGANYVVLTIRAPDGKICQIALSKGVYPWSRWRVLEQTLKVSEMISPLYAGSAEDSKWMDELGITAQQLDEYYLKHPQMTQEELKEAFVDKITGLHVLPDDWQGTAGANAHFKLETGKEKGFRSISNIAGDASSDTYWKVDYPGYVGPGYRSYLYDKINQNRER
jgi:hypothetical protein